MHIPVLCGEVITYLEPRPGDVILDCTVNGGGHAQAILEKITPNGFLIGIDQDRQALKFAEDRLSKFKGSFVLVKENFRNLDRVISDFGAVGTDGIIFDLGLSSLQLEDEGRGFSIRLNGPLDMRMDMDNSLKASDIVNKWSTDEIDWILREYGQERWHRRIARAIVERRKEKPVTRTKELTQIVERALPYKGKMRIHPATRTFQALRIAVNKELSALDETLAKAFAYLKPTARLCVLSYHSLEDKIVKEKFKAASSEGQLRILTKKPIRPTEEEIKKNPRSRSARLRAAERV